MENRWKKWVAENVLLGCPSEQLIKILEDNGIDHRAAATEIAGARAHPYVDGARTVIQRGLKLEAFFKAYSKLSAMTHTGEIERRTGVGEREFLTRYYSTNTPVVLTDVVHLWAAAREWTPDYFKSKCGTVLVEMQGARNSDPNYERDLDKHRQKILFHDYVDKVTNAGASNDFYMVANNKNLAPDGLGALLADLKPLPDFLDESSLVGSVYLWYGPAGTVTPLHHDTMNILLTQIQGEKRVRMFSPFFAPYLYNEVGVFSEIDPENPDLEKFPLYANVRSFEVTLAPGDALFIPVGWWHHVRSLSVSVSVSFNNFKFANMYDWDDVGRY